MRNVLKKWCAPRQKGCMIIQSSWVHTFISQHIRCSKAIRAADVHLDACMLLARGLAQAGHYSPACCDTAIRVELVGLCSPRPSLRSSDGSNHRNHQSVPRTSNVSCEHSKGSTATRHIVSAA